MPSPRLVTGVVLGTLALLTVGAAPAHADKCTGAKLKAIGKKESGLLGCQAKVAATNDSSGLSACEAKVKLKFSAAFTKAGTCAGEQVTCEIIADGCESAVAGAMTDTFPSRCEAAKRKAAGKLGSGELGCYSKAAAKSVPVDIVTCIPKAQGKFTAALTKAGGCPDGGSPQSLVEDNCIQPAVTTDGGGMVTDVCPTTTTTSTTPTTTSTSTSTSTTTSTTSTTTSSTSSTTTTTTTATTTTTSSTTTSTTTSTSGTTTTCPLPATGQMTCWDSGGTVIPCAGTGQDGELRKGAPLSYSDNGDGTITDNDTGLVWEKQSMDGSVHDVGNTYTWAQAFSGHVATLNSTSFAGHTDWRVPNVRELLSILNYQNFAPAVSPAFNTGCTAGCTVLTCSCTKPSGTDYWSSTTDALSTGNAWPVQFGNGGNGSVTRNKASAVLSVRAVRGASSCLPATGQTTCWDSNGTVIPCAGTGQDGELQEGAPPAYVDNGDGTISDADTGLMWEKQSMDGSVHDVGNTYTWDQAFSGHVATLNSTSFAGHTDWRVPNVKELQSIANFQNINPSVSPAFNTGCTAGCTVLTCSCTASSDHWSSTTFAGTRPDFGWVVSFGNGNVHFGINKASLTINVRAVRGGL